MVDDSPQYIIAEFVIHKPTLEVGRKQRQENGSGTVRRIYLEPDREKMWNSRKKF